MGHQVQCYWLPSDLKQFLSFVSNHNPVTVAIRDGSKPNVEDIDEPHLTDGTLSLWNHDLLPCKA